MQRNVTLTVDETLIERARERAERDKTTLDELFGHWLERYLEQERSARKYDELMERLSYARSSGPYTRDELNERR